MEKYREYELKPNELKPKSKNELEPKFFFEIWAFFFFLVSFNPSGDIGRQKDLGFSSYESNPKNFMQNRNFFMILQNFFIVISFYVSNFHEYTN